MRRTRTGVFVSLTGEYQNVGDGVIRRVVLDWVRQESGVTAYLGGAPDHWVEQMQFSPSDRLVRGGIRAYVSWLWGLVKYRGHPVLVTEPGEMTLARYNFPRQAAILLAACVTRLKGGAIVLPPRATRRPWGPTLWAHRRISSLAAISLWRDQPSLDLIRTGEIVPDTAFDLPLRWDTPTTERRTLFVSLRGARPAPDDTWYRAVADFAGHLGLGIVVAAQVEQDDRRAAEIAARLNAEYLPWTGAGIDREVQLRNVYDHTKVAIADRLHVLILAAMSGAVPVEAVANPTAKVSSHFETAGIRGISLDSAGLDAATIFEWLVTQAQRDVDIRTALEDAHSSMETVRERVGRLLD